MEITYLDHSGFVARIDGAILVFDYYRDPSHALLHTLRKYPDLPVVFFVSHAHSDHYNPDIYEIGQQHRRVYVMSNDVLPQNVPSTLEVAGMSCGDTLEDLPGGISVKAYGSTDQGVSFMVTLPDGRRIFHAGDLNDWHWENEIPEAVKSDPAFVNKEDHALEKEARLERRAADTAEALNASDDGGRNRAADYLRAEARRAESRAESARTKAVRQEEKADDKFRTIIGRIADEVPEINVAMFPVDTRMGEGFARGARIFLDKIRVDNFFPMHFAASTYREACDTTLYEPLAGPNKGATTFYCLHTPGESIRLKEQTATV